MSNEEILQIIEGIVQNKDRIIENIKSGKDFWLCLGNKKMLKKKELIMVSIKKEKKEDIWYE